MPSKLTGTKVYLDGLFRNGFFRSVSILLGGTAVAQVLTLLALPFLTRIYSPDEFSILAVYVAILTISSVAACLRLDIAIPLPGDDADAINLLAVSLLICTGTAVIVAIILFFFGTRFFGQTGWSEINAFVWLLPVGLWLAASYSALQHWATRKKRFSSIAYTRVVQASGGVGTQLGLGMAGAGPLGLLLGHTLLTGAGVVKLGREAGQETRLLRKVNFRTMKACFWNYRRFPQYSTFEALANNSSYQIPIILIGALAVGPEAGFVLLATRVMNGPVTLIGKAVGQVYLSRAPEEMRHDRLPTMTTGVLTWLARLGVAPLVFVGIVAPSTFAVAFGDEWQRAGQLVAWVTPWFILKLMSSPIAMAMHVRMMQRAMLMLMIFGLTVRIGVTLGAFLINPLYIAEGYAISGAVFYGVALIVYLYASGAGGSAALAMFRALAFPVLAAVFLGVFVTAWLA